MSWGKSSYTHSMLTGGSGQVHRGRNVTCFCDTGQTTGIFLSTLILCAFLPMKKTIRMLLLPSPAGNKSETHPLYVVSDLYSSRVGVICVYSPPVSIIFKWALSNHAHNRRMVSTRHVVQTATTEEKPTLTIQQGFGCFRVASHMEARAAISASLPQRQTKMAALSLSNRFVG